jgi:hypothetical protein
LRLLEENIKETSQDIGTGNYFLNRTPIAQKIRIRIDKWDCTILKSFCTTKETTELREPT